MCPDRASIFVGITSNKARDKGQGTVAYLGNVGHNTQQ